MDFEGKASKVMRPKRRKSADEIEERIVNGETKRDHWARWRGELTVDSGDEDSN